jgi:methylenetetrahydrofolate reductase (NADPH)
VIHSPDGSCFEVVDQPLKTLLHAYSIEVVARDLKGIAKASAVLRPGTEVFVPSLPKDTVDNLVVACVAQRLAGMNPVPHITARTIPSRAVLARTLERLAAEAQVDQALVIGGDTDKAVGEFDAAIQLIDTGLFEANGIKRIILAVHPEGHPRVPDAVMWPALLLKLKAAAERGLDTDLVSQFAFDAAPYIATARRLRASGITQPLRVGVAGPAKRTTLIKYALMCGVGASLRALRERHDFAAHMAAGETPEALLRELAAAQVAEPSLGIDGVHFFTFGSIEGSVRLAESLCKLTPTGSQGSDQRAE